MPRKDPATATDEPLTLKFPKGTGSYRTILLVIVLSMHPLGQAILRGLGFNLPFDQGHKTTTELQHIDSKVDALASRFDVLEKRFGSFEFTLSRIHDDHSTKK